jgi:hypothetical protein
MEQALRPLRARRVCALQSCGAAARKHCCAAASYCSTAHQAAHWAAVAAVAAAAAAALPPSPLRPASAPLVAAMCAARGAWIIAARITARIAA